MTDDLTLVVVTPECTRHYRVPAVPGMTLLDALLLVQEREDPGLSLNWNCRTAQCGICAVSADGVPTLACMSAVRAGCSYEVAPILPARHLRGLVCDLSEVYRDFFAATARRGKERVKKERFETLLITPLGDEQQC
ncbi:MAG: 2Fe-2S iron-sulfur cluster binding domain-containing protein [Armatimonadetes bacterium]|nr:2Fe-2S iron-sulfur cluster binding domain-containing protein [Armatimonadota bacterium]